jgi:transcriptional regulator with XRE-family HTH domain
MDIPAIYAHIGNAVRRLRKGREMTQEQLASLMDISRASLANIEIGRQSVLVHQLFNFAARLDVEIEELLPPRVSADPVNSRPALPLPKGLNQLHKEQITRLLGESPLIAKATPKRVNNVSKAKRRSEG